MPFVYNYKGKRIRYDDMITLHDVDDNFSYQGYLEEYAENVLKFLSEPIDFDSLGSNDIKKENLEYEQAISELYAEFSRYANEYEILYQEKGIDPTENIKELAQLYRQLLTFLEEEAKKEKIKEQRLSLIRVLKRVCLQKKIAEDAESAKRVIAFKEGNITIQELKFRDLKEFVTNKKIINLQRVLRSKFNEEILRLDYNNMTIREIINFLNLEEGLKRK